MSAFWNSVFLLNFYLFIAIHIQKQRLTIMIRAVYRNWKHAIRYILEIFRFSEEDEFFLSDLFKKQAKKVMSKLKTKRENIADIQVSL